MVTSMPVTSCVAAVTVPLPVTAPVAAAAGDGVAVGRARLAPVKVKPVVFPCRGVHGRLVGRDRVAAGDAVSSVAVAVAACRYCRPCRSK